MIKIPLRFRAGEIRAFALVDDEDARLAKLRWCLDSRGYAKRGIRVTGDHLQKTQLLHREILGLMPGDPEEIDHKDGNRLDCRRHNLRLVTRAENGQNVVSKRGARSRHRGVIWHKATGKWGAQVVLNQKHHWLGVFESEDDAARVAREFRIKSMSHTNEDRAAA